MTIKIYGPAASRAARTLWIVHELGIPFEHVAMEMKDLKGPEYLKINPNGKMTQRDQGAHFRTNPRREAENRVLILQWAT